MPRTAHASSAPVLQRAVRGAYTLIEVLMVVVLMGIAAAAIVPAMGSTDVLRVQAAVRQIVGDINYAQSDALARQQGRAVVFSTDTNSYSIVRITGAELHPDTDTIQTASLSKGAVYGDSKITKVTFGDAAELYFDEMGGPVSEPMGITPSPGGTVEITGAGGSFRITVEAYTGRVTVERIGG